MSAGNSILSQESIEYIVLSAMQYHWNDIVSDTDSFPDDIESSNPKTSIAFSPGYWADRVARIVAIQVIENLTKKECASFMWFDPKGFPGKHETLANPLASMSNATQNANIIKRMCNMSSDIESYKNSPNATNNSLLTPASEKGIKDFFEGLCSIKETLLFSAHAGAAIAVTPSIMELLINYCGSDPRFNEIASNLKLIEYSEMKKS